MEVVTFVEAESRVAEVGRSLEESPETENQMETLAEEVLAGDCQK